jgi:hypothetical protein
MIKVVFQTIIYPERTRSKSAREHYLKVIWIAPNGSYTFVDIKKAFRKRDMQFHPDRHVGKSEDFLREMGEKFKEVKDVFDGLVNEWCVIIDCIAILPFIAGINLLLWIVVIFC